MARFDWPKFLRQHRIEYVTSGPNVARGNLNLRCPWCGENDPSEHMGLSPQGWWGCLRNASHRGKSPVRLIRQLLHCSEEEARRLAGETATVAPSTNELSKSFAALKTASGRPTRTQEKALVLPPEFKPLGNGSPLSVAFLGYLEERGFRSAQVEWLIKTYNLHYANKGLFSGRIILPIQDRYGALVSWTGRTIYREAQPRYRTLRMSDPEEDGEPVAKLAVNHTVLGLPALWSCANPMALVLVEGPFDALKISAFGYAMGVWATCLFGLNVYPQQVEVLQELAGRFERIYLLLDEDAELQRLRLLKQLTSLPISVLRMPSNTDDPGALSAAQVTQLALEISANVTN